MARLVEFFQIFPVYPVGRGPRTVGAPKNRVENFAPRSPETKRVPNPTLYRAVGLDKIYERKKFRRPSFDGSRNIPVLTQNFRPRFPALLGAAGFCISAQYVGIV